MMLNAELAEAYMALSDWTNANIYGHDFEDLAKKLKNTLQSGHFILV